MNNTTAVSQCPSAATTPSKTSIEDLPEIMINGHILDKQSLAEELQYHPHHEFDTVVQQSAQSLAIQYLLQQEIRQQTALEESSTADDENRISELVEQNSQIEPIDDDTCKRYFEAHTNKFTTSPLLELSHILLAAAPDDIETRDQQKTKALTLIEQLNQHPEQFAALALEHSACPSKNTGGSMGQIDRGQTVEEFERQVFSLKPGLAQNPIESRYGIHVVHIERKIDGKALPYEMVVDKIRQYLYHQKKNLAVQKYLFELLSKAEIEGLEIQFDDKNIYH